MASGVRWINDPNAMIKKLPIIIIAIFALTIAYFFIFPDISKLKKENPTKTSFMKYRESEWKEKGKKAKIRQIWVSLSHISPYLTKAVLIAEDDKFWHHDGFDFEAIEKAVEKNIKSGKFKAGGSTISQQLAKNLYLTPTKTL